MTDRAVEIAEQRVRELLAQDAVARGLGVTVSRARPGEVATHLIVSAEMLNGHGSAHASVLFALAAIAFAGASNSHGEAAIGRSCAIDYLEPAFAGDALTATAAERAREGRTGLYDVAVRRDGDGALIAELRGVSRPLPQRRAAG